MKASSERQYCASLLNSLTCPFPDTQLPIRRGINVLMVALHWYCHTFGPQRISIRLDIYLLIYGTLQGNYSSKRVTQSGLKGIRTLSHVLSWVGVPWTRFVWFAIFLFIVIVAAVCGSICGESFINGSSFRSSLQSQHGSSTLEKELKQQIDEWVFFFWLFAIALGDSGN